MRIFALMRIFVLALWEGCPRPVPEHLRLDAPGLDAPAATRPATPAEALAKAVGTDPLARTSRLAAEDLAGIDAPDLRAFVDAIATIESGRADAWPVLLRLEEDHRGTAVVALTRGYRLRSVERLVHAPDPDSRRQVALHLAPLDGAERWSAALRDPLAWLGESEPLAHAEDRVLLGWLDAPAVDVSAVVRALAQPQFTSLAERPYGRMLRTRGEPGGPEVPASSLLAEATRAGLQRVAADRDREQAAWAKERARLREVLGTTEEPDVALLARAREGLGWECRNERRCGEVLLAEAAWRWRTQRAPMGVSDFGAAIRWNPSLTGLARTWEVIALKDAIEGMDAGHDTIRYPAAMARLVDALVGTGIRGLPLALLETDVEDPSAWLALGRGVGVDGITSWEDLKDGLGRHLQQAAERALEATSDEDDRRWLQTISARAVP